MSFRSERKWAEITIFLTNNSISKIKFSINGKGDQNRIEGELMRWIIEQVSTKKNKHKKKCSNYFFDTNPTNAKHADDDQYFGLN
jgi:hypothetical protein